MMRNKIIIWTGILLLLFTACQKEEFLAEEGRNGEVTITSTISPMMDGLTRAAVNSLTDGKVEFTVGDKISLFVTPENGNTTKYDATYELDPATQKAFWNLGTKLTWAELNAKTTFTAFWPAIAENGNQQHLHNVNSQKWNNSVASSDILLATVVVNKGMPVNLDFKHAVSLVKVTIKPSEEIKEGAITSLGQVKIKACNGMSINTTTGKITPATGMVKEFYMNNGQGRTLTFSALVCPQLIQQDWRDNSWISISVNGGQNWASYKAPKIFSNGTEFKELEPGKVVTINLSTNSADNTAELTDINSRTRWAEGLDVPDLMKWGYVDKGSKLLGLTWTKNSGWYDCKKFNPDFRMGHVCAYPFDDALICWAATTSNMLHWWLDRNQANLDRFGYTGPRGYEDALHSEVFHQFKKAFIDHSGWEHDGCKWFINGNFKPTNYDVGGENVGRGFFREVFNDEAVTENAPNSILKRAFAGGVGDLLKTAYPKEPGAEKYTVGFATLQGSHAMTIWGAAFDESGEPTHVYVCDNNTRDWEFEPSNPADEYNPAPIIRDMIPGEECNAGMTLRRVRNNNGAWEIEMSNGWDQFWDITLLGIGQKHWDAFFAAHPNWDPETHTDR